MRSRPNNSGGSAQGSAKNKCQPPNAKAQSAKAQSAKAQGGARSGRKAAHKTPGKTPGGAGRVRLLGSILTRRDSFILVVFTLLLAVLVVRLCSLTIIEAEALASEGSEQRTVTYTLTARRGTIYDRNGNVLATSVDASTIYANPSKIADLEETAGVLSDILGGTATEYLSLIAEDPEATFVYLAKKADTEYEQAIKDANQAYIDAEVERIRERGDDIPAEIITPLTGIEFLPDTRREYPKGSIGAQVIGSVNDEGEGVSGIEQTYDSILRGVDGQRVVEEAKQISQNTEPLPMINSIVEETEPTSGNDIIISLDIETQQFLEQNLQATAASHKTKNASSILYDGSTGEIIASASIPLYDREKVTVEELEGGATNAKAITMPYEPGSTFKVCVAAAALAEGLMTAESTVNCPASLQIYDYTVKDAVERGDATMSLRQIIANSSNVGVSLIEQQLGDEVFSRYLTELGLGQFTHVDYPGETTGSLAAVEDWTPIQASNISFGQGLEVSSLQVASIYGTIANDGVLMQPHFLIARPQFDGELNYESRRIFTTQTARNVEDLLRSVVTEGTGTAAALEGYDVVGKTGTAEKSNLIGGYEATMGENIYSFAGYLDNTTSNFVFVSSFDDPTGFTTAPSTTLFPIVMSFVANRYVVELEEELAPVNQEELALGQEGTLAEFGSGGSASGEALEGGNTASDTNEGSTESGSSTRASGSATAVIRPPTPRPGSDWAVDTSG